jgi:hypothetical protein
MACCRALVCQARAINQQAFYLDARWFISMFDEIKTGKKLCLRKLIAFSRGQPWVGFSLN